MNTKKLSEVCGLTARRLDQLTRENILPQKSQGEWPDADAVLKALFRHFHSRQLDEAKRRFDAARASREELKLALEQGNSIPTEDVIEAWSDVVLMMKSRLLSAGHNLESRGLITHDVRVLVDGEVTEALSELSKAISYRADAEQKSQTASKKKTAE
jgi:phage terminase Nu1 subunit (DNA packaging protein)